MRYSSLLLLGFVAACATTSHSERDALLAAPIDCAQAEQDIAALEAALPSRRERARSAVQTVTPVGAATGVVTGSYDERAAVLTGATKDELSARIAEIEATCGLTDGETPAGMQAAE